MSNKNDILREIRLFNDNCGKSTFIIKKDMIEVIYENELVEDSFIRIIKVKKEIIDSLYMNLKRKNININYSNSLSVSLDDFTSKRVLKDTYNYLKDWWLND